MDDGELDVVIAKLRAFAAAHGMQWVLNEVDEAISLGIPEPRTLRQATRRGRTSYEDVTDSLPTVTKELRPASQDQDARAQRNPRKTEQFVRRRPMTPHERAALLLQALRRVLVEVGEIAEGSLEALNPHERLTGLPHAEIQDFSLPPILSISFAPDEGSASPGIEINTFLDSLRAARIEELLMQIEDEINS